MSPGMGETSASRPSRTAFDVRELDEADIAAIDPIDVSEEGDVVYVYADGVLRSVEETWRRPKPTAAAWRSWVDEVGAKLQPDVWLGLFEGGRLAGLASIRYRLGDGSTAQLTTLHVDRAFRRQGVGERLLEASIERALEHGAANMYVSATPSASAISFYRRNGFEPTPQPDPGLFELEPEDIHMIRRLSAPGRAHSR